MRLHLTYTPHHALLSIAAAVLLAITGCTSKHDSHISVPDNMVEGKWLRNGTQEYWLYQTDHTGVTWDEADDISRDESNLRFTWSVQQDVITHVFSGAQGNQAVPKVYTITEIDSHTMRWEDDYGLTFALTKVE